MENATTSPLVTVNVIGAISEKRMHELGIIDLAQLGDLMTEIEAEIEIARQHCGAIVEKFEAAALQRLKGRTVVVPEVDDEH